MLNELSSASGLTEKILLRKFKTATKEPWGEEEAWELKGGNNQYRVIFINKEVRHLLQTMTYYINYCAWDNFFINTILHALFVPKSNIRKLETFVA